MKHDSEGGARPGRADRARVRAAWESSGSGARYARERFSSRRAMERDPRLVARALRRHGLRGPVLDVPSGTGRMSPVLARGMVVAVDVSRAMLAEDPRARRVQASVFALPFRARSFDAVVCCRLLHHLREPADLDAAVAELVRVSARLVVASFWDAASLPALRRRCCAKPTEARVAIPYALLARAFERAGAPLVDRLHSLRFVSRQAFVVALRSEP